MNGDNDHKNQYVIFSHMLLKELNLVDEPYMLTEVDRNKDKVTCRCFYASVVFYPKVIMVFYNPDGGMCPLNEDYLVKLYKNDAIKVEAEPLRKQIEDSVKSKNNQK